MEQPATFLHRVSNCLIDLVCLSIIVLLCSGFLGSFRGGKLGMFAAGLFLVLFFAYYIFLELWLGQTAGKFVTKTRVVSKDGGKLNLGQAVVRTLVRLIPLDPISFLFNKERVFWHDAIANTKVIQIL